MTGTSTANLNEGRTDWVDIAKGICIVAVVMMHATLGVEAAAGREGWMHHVVAFAAPFRMPDFFLIAGLFLARRIDRPWVDYLDRKVVHFAYFYLLWLVIQFAFKAPGFVTEFGAAGTAHLFARSLIEPFGTMWFVYILPVFFVVTKLLRRLPVLAVFAAAAILEASGLQTGWLVIDEFANRFVYFFAGYAFAPTIFAFALRVGPAGLLAPAGLAVWAVVNAGAVAAGIAGAPVISLVLGLAGALAIAAAAVLLTRLPLAAALRYAGEHSLVIYLAFFLPMAVGRIVLLKLGIVPDVGTMSLLVTLGAIVTPLAIHAFVRGTSLRFLFERPAWARLDRPARRLVPAE